MTACGVIGIVERLVSEHGACDGEEPVCDGPESSGMPVTARAEGGVLCGAKRVAPPHPYHRAGHRSVRLSGRSGGGRSASWAAMTARSAAVLASVARRSRMDRKSCCSTCRHFLRRRRRPAAEVPEAGTELHDWRGVHPRRSCRGLGLVCGTVGGSISPWPSAKEHFWVYDFCGSGDRDETRPRRTERILHVVRI